MELNVNTNVSFNDPIQYGIYDITHMLMTEETNHEEYREFSNLYGDMTINGQPITMQYKGHIEFIQEALSHKYPLESQVNLQVKMHHSSLDSISTFYNSSNDFDDVIIERLESSLL